jgi:3-oxoacyl-[acyl-carrier protein] reductase
MRTVLITGGSRGIGAAVARRYERGGWTVMAPTREDLDLADAGSVAAWLAGPQGAMADAVVNNAAENIVAAIPALDDASWSRMLQVNLTSPFQLIRHVGGAMAQRRWGRIVNIGSAFSFVGRAGRAGYTTSKTGLLGLTRAAAIEFAPHNVLVNLVSPGFIETDMTRANNAPDQLAVLAAQVPLGRLGTAEEVAELVFFLGSDSNTYITGAGIPVDGGFLCQ